LSHSANKMCYSTAPVESADVDTPSVAKTRSHKNMTDEDFEQLPAENIDWEQLGSDNRELLRDWSQRKEQEFLDVAIQSQHASSVGSVGRDRFFRCYWVFRSIPGLFVEGNTADFSTSEQSQHSDGPLSDEISANNSTDVEIPAPSQTRWSVYGSVEDVDRLLESLNARGLREGPLRSSLVEQRDRLKNWVNQCDVAVLSTPSSVSEIKKENADENDSLVSAVREMVLEFEERVYSGSLGALKVRQLSCSSGCKGEGKGIWICIAPHREKLTSEAPRYGSHSLYTANTLHLPSPRNRSPDGATTIDSDSSHQIAAYYSFVDPERMK